ncbi:hypothetical protein SAY87_024149 [Trapa incisa]|uniref:Uncharacterized protein n=1 Tax=Trapa incisa TaxID=236973 RepID=A0AAN7KTS5_9MYRT|nr:hypothetical protein SAY87_024149 [Trapa incisa]
MPRILLWGLPAINIGMPSEKLKILGTLYAQYWGSTIVVADVLCKFVQCGYSFLCLVDAQSQQKVSHGGAAAAGAAAMIPLVLKRQAV